MTLDNKSRTFPRFWRSVLILGVALHLVASSPSGDGGDGELIVETNSGMVRGQTMDSLTGKLVDVWMSIPYAEPPLGNLRFLPPKPVESWTDVINATKAPNSCTQVMKTAYSHFAGAWPYLANTPLSEDCLYLNVAVPKPRKQNLAVMVWIYGGGFYSGTSTLDYYDLRTLAAEADVVAVSMQYRLSSLGFLYTGTEEAPGNVGLLDQNLALKWVHENIEKFGGDPKRVTIFGESAGGASVAYHLLSPMSHDFFQRAILQSGTALAPWGFKTTESAINKTLQLAKAVNCTHEADQMPEVVECLRTKDAEELIANEWNSLGTAEFPFVPVVDGKFVEDSPENLLRDGKFKKTEILTGVTKNEGTLFLLYFFGGKFNYQTNLTVTREEFFALLQKSFSFVNAVGHDAIRFEYTNWEKPESTEKYIEALDGVFADPFLVCSVQEWAERYAEDGNNVYFYVYNHRSTDDRWPKWAKVEHGSELPFVFGGALDPNLPFLDEERELSKEIIQMWSHFAKFGDPNSEDSPTKWPVYKAGERSYLELRADESTIGQGPRTRQCRFWKDYLPRLMKQTKQSC